MCKYIVLMISILSVMVYKMTYFCLNGYRRTSLFLMISFNQLYIYFIRKPSTSLKLDILTIFLIDSPYFSLYGEEDSKCTWPLTLDMIILRSVQSANMRSHEQTNFLIGFCCRIILKQQEKYMLQLSHPLNYFMPSEK